MCDLGCKRYMAAGYISTLCLFCSTLLAGITGTISGVVRDRDTGQVLPGAQIRVEGTTSGAMADKNGYYIIHNLPAGVYDVSVTMIGYAKVTVRNVQVNVDLNTELNFDLVTQVLRLEEVVVTEKKSLIHPEITSSTYFVSGEAINEQLPVDSYREAIALLPGVVGDHFRGGRETDVVYMVDGLPIQGTLSREISSYFPNGSIVEMMVQTGGYAAEYGNATSGIVNVVTKDGRNKVEGGVKFYTDFVNTGLTDNDNTRRFEFNVGGPLTFGFGGPIIDANYFVSADLNLSDTAFGEQLRQAFDSPVFKNLNLNTKLSFDLSKNTLLSFQGLLSNWSWRKFDPQWAQNVDGLAKHKHFSHRISASLTHTFSPELFASVRLGRYSYKRIVEGAADGEPTLVFQNPNDPTSPVVQGQQPWDEDSKERIHILKFDLVGRVRPEHLLKVGLEYQDYDVRSRSVRFDYLAVPRQNTLVFNRSANTVNYKPRIFSVYAQDKVEYKGVTANLGFRYEIFSPHVRIEELPDRFQDLRQKLGLPPARERAQTDQVLSPRIGISFPLSEHERLHVNYGWYYQMPELFYYYLNRDTNLDGYLPLLGSTDLEPVRTISSEFSYKRRVAEDLLFVLTGFIKRFDHLVDTQTFVLPDSTVSGEVQSIGLSEYSSSARGQASGFEVTLQKQVTPAVSARVSYTYMKARGTSSAAEDNFRRAVAGKPAPKGTQFPLSWDQRHSLILDARYETLRLDVSVLYRLFSPLPFTTPGSPTPNNARLSWRHILDLRVKFKSDGVLGGTLYPFLEVRNLLNEKNVINAPDDTGVRAYRLFDPINSNYGRRLRLGLALNF